MLIKYFIQFSVDGQGSIPSLLFYLRPNYAGCNEDTLAPSSWFLTHSRFCLSPLSISDIMGFDSKCDFTPPTILLGLLFFWMWDIFFWWDPTFSWGFPGGSVGKESAYSVGEPCLTPGLVRCPGEGSGNPLLYSCLENPMDRGAWWATVHGFAELDMIE